MRWVRTLVLSVCTAVIAGAMGMGCTSLDRWERRAIFQHEVALRGDAALAPEGVQQFDLALPNGGVTGKDKVHLWYLPGQRGAPTVLYLHGARHSLYSTAARLERLQELGFNVLALEYRGFGRSTDVLPSERTAIEDAKVAFAELARREPDPARRLVYGYSLGGAVAIALAHDVEGLAGVVVESTFTSIPDVVRTTRWGWLPFIRIAVTQDFNSEARIRAVDKPLLFLHGTADGIVPHTMSDRLYEAAARVPAQYKRIVKIDGASHRGALAMALVDYGDALRQFVQLAGTRQARAPLSIAVSGAAAAPAGAALH